jgi:predicted type IV restriction endonuclease
MGFNEDLRHLAEQVRKRQANIKGEEATKQALVLPFLQVLGYDVYDPTVVVPEYVADFAKKKSGGPCEKVDYMLQKNGVPAVFIECKAVDAPLPNHDAQLARYFNATPAVKLGVITDGVHYRFFTDLREPNMMDAAPFFEFNILSFGDREVENLSRYTLDSFQFDAVQSHAQDLLFIEKVTGLINELLRNPSEDFVRFLLKDLNLVQGNLTAKVVERFVPIVKKAIQTTLVEMMTKSLRHEIAQPETPPAPAVVALTPPAPSVAARVAPPPRVTVPAEETSGEAAPAAGKVETTEEELALFELTKAICAESATAKSALAYKDTVTYFGVNLGRVTRWFLRYYGNGAKKFVVIRLPVDVAKAGAQGVEIESVGDETDRCRINVQGPQDIERFKPLVLQAYELESARDVSRDKD